MIITHLRLVRLGQDLESLNTRAKIKFGTGIAPTLAFSPDVCPPYCATGTVGSLPFAPF